jgi:hypothetical protein
MTIFRGMSSRPSLPECPLLFVGVVNEISSKSSSEELGGGVPSSRTLRTNLVQGGMSQQRTSPTTFEPLACSSILSVPLSPA